MLRDISLLAMHKLVAGQKSAIGKTANKVELPKAKVVTEE
jgi:hypothetical protein